MIRLATISLGVLLLSSCATAPDVSLAARSELAPTGKLRVGINVQNFLLVNKERTGGEYGGIAVDLGREFGRRLGVPVELVAFDTVGKLADAVKAGSWDVAFLGNEPARANEIAFSAAYLEIPVTFLVPAGSKIKSIGEIDADGVRVAVSEKSAYDLYLTRTLKRAKLVCVQGIEASFKHFLDHKLEALAGLKPRLVYDSEELPGSRVLGGQITGVQQSVGTHKARARAAAFLREFVDEVKRSGFVARTIEKHKIRGVTVAPGG